MPHSEQYAKELLRNLSQRIELLERRKYWDLTVLRLYLDLCDRVLFDDPTAGLEAAQIAPELARLIPKRRPLDWERFSEESERRQHRELLAKSFAVLGGALRVAGEFEKAESSYEEALRVCESGTIGPTVKASIDKRLAKLRSAQRRFDEALNLLDSALEVFQGQDDVCFADALVTKGYVLCESGRLSEAIPHLAKALRLVGQKGKRDSLASRVFHSAVHNLAGATFLGCGSKDIILALGYVTEAKRSLAKKPNSINKHKLAWVEGRIAARLGSTRFAERLYLRAMKQLQKLGAPFDSALVALDLSLIYLQERQWVRLRELAALTAERFVEMSGNTEAVAALRLWAEGARMSTLSKAMILNAREAIENHVRRHPP